MAIAERMLRAAKLESELYEEVEKDESATMEALYVVVIVALASGIGAALSGAARGNVVLALIGGVVAAVLGWVVWAAITYFIGTRLLGGTATLGEMLRTLGYAQAPGVLRIFAFIPGLGTLISIIVAIWMLVAGVIAIRQALDFSTGRAIVTVLLGWLAALILSVALALLGLGAAFIVGGA